MKIKNLLICLAAGNSQKNLIFRAKSLGYLIVAIDQNKKAPGFEFADFKIIKSTHDSDLVIKELKKLNKHYEFVGVLNRSSGPPVITASKICKYFDIPGVPIRSAKILINKDLMRYEFKRKNIPIPNFKIFLINKFKNNNKFLFPVVFKPALSLRGKFGVSIVNSEDRIDRAVKYAEKYSINNKIIMEEYLDGPDLSLISFVDKNKLFPICLLEEINRVEKNGRVTRRGYRTLKNENKHWFSESCRIAKNIISEFNIIRSPLMISFRPDPMNKLKIIEVHLDIGGELLIEKFYPNALSFDYTSLIFSFVTGKIQKIKKFELKPTAIFYNARRVSANKYQLVKAKNEKILENKIISLNK